MARRAELTFDGDLARLALVRVDAGNAIDTAMVVALDEAVSALAARADARALLLCAEGQAFTVGGDLRHFAERRERLGEELAEMIGVYHEALAHLAALPLPIVCAVQGAAAGGGLGLLWCADVVLAADDAKFATGFVRLGLSGDGGSSWWLPRLVGLRRARELLLEGRVLSADEAADWGLVSRVVPRDRLQDEALAVARELAAGPTLAFAEIRHLLHQAHSTSLVEQLGEERRAMARCGATADAREGVAAFVERRTPSFEGR